MPQPSGPGQVACYLHSAIQAECSAGVNEMLRAVACISQSAGVSHLINGPGSLEAGVYPALRSSYGQILISSFIDC
jgi:hypothetical protein